jgi:putative DNA primase/helicase
VNEEYHQREASTPGNSVQEHHTENGHNGTRYAVTPLHRFPTNENAPKFPTDALPKPVERLVNEAAKSIGCPPDAIALGTLVALGAAIGNSRVIQPKRNWTESATIFGAVIADPGEKKTAAIKVATNPARKLENKLQKKHEQAIDEHATELRAHEVDKKNASKAGEPAPPPPRPPIASRVRVNDTTVEAIIPILKDNPRGLILERDELVGWVKGMDQYKAGGRGSERQFWLSVWSNEPTSVDRKGQEAPISVLKPFIGVVGSIQPDILGELAENREDGMLERFLFCYPKTLNAMWTEDDISEGALVGYQDLYHRLRNLSMVKDEDGDPIEVPVTFSPEAKEVYIDLYNSHRREMATPGFPRYLRSVWAKLEAYTLRLTLIVACCRFTENSVAERVEVEDVMRAASLADHFEEQARRVFGTLYGFDAKKRLLEDVSRFVAKEGGLWMGTATELHQQFHSTHKPERPDELSKFVKDAAEDEEGFIYHSETDRYKDEASGEWKSRRLITLKRKMA